MQAHATWHQDVFSKNIWQTPKIEHSTKKPQEFQLHEEQNIIKHPFLFTSKHH